MERYFLTLDLNENYTAGAKAKIDMEYFLYQYGFKKCILYNGTSRLNKLVSFSKNLYKLVIGKKEKVIFATHYPLLNPMLLKMFIKILKLSKYNFKLIGIIHDIDSVRYQRNLSAIKKEIEILNMFDYLISHNSTMTKWLINQGFEGRAKELELFDYKVSNKESTEQIKITGHEKEFGEWKHVVLFAGNLNQIKSGFIYSLNEIDSPNLFLIYMVQIIIHPKF